MERKNEIAAKKAKLAELRRQREEREQRQKTLPKGGPPAEDASEVRLLQRTPTEALTLTFQGSYPGRARTKDRQELDSFITTLVGEGKRASLQPGEIGTSSPARRGRPSSALGAGQLRSDSQDPGTVTPPAPQSHTISAATQTLTTIPVSTNYEFVPVTATSEKISYSKGIQTAEPWSPQRRSRQSDGLSGSESDRSPSTKSNARAEGNESERRSFAKI